LKQNYPNPFNPGTMISFSLDAKQFVSINIYNSIGDQVQSLINVEQPAGLYSLYFDGRDMSSGIYYCVLKAGNRTSTKKMMLVK